jgi:hypothetical protein
MVGLPEKCIVRGCTHIALQASPQPSNSAHSHANSPLLKYRSHTRTFIRFILLV